ncbi:hypothetical protein [Kordiimonas sp.]|uniref:hypothetical protein n=1 Tax=Kordiimonas sp. TaxID=1970157 RepID=UPI003B518199
MIRRSLKKRPASPQVDFGAMSDQKLHAYAVAAGLPALCVRWKRETIIRKLTGG